MNKPILGISLLVLSLLVSSCNLFRHAATSTDELPERSAKFLLKKLVQQQVDLEWFSAKARINYADENFSISATANLRMRKDSIIWANVKKLNIEAGRALIRPDSFFVIDRINRQYSRQPVSAITDMFQVPANFQMLQTILLGNPVFLTTDLQAGVEAPFYTLRGEDDRYTTIYHLDGKDYSLQKITFIEKMERREVSMGLSDYKTLGKKQKFAYFRTLRVDSPQTGPLFIEIEFSKLEINTPKSIEFEIPSRYSEIN
ncbi:MAG: DUF4292 domain-containing protein [Saprospirales bacterium]|nr:DUF4292 domain-containing protein [Saprospirales bacterium]MBK8489585.1 DUF4292 domain-containing protein [Saprospirales bacterium]